MSINRAIRSDGTPYFALVQRNLEFMDSTSLQPAGVYEAQIVVRLFDMPLRLADDDEMHPLFSFNEEHPSGAGLFEFGVTPDGRVKFVDAAGTVLQTSGGAISADGRFHTIQVYNDPGTTYARIVLDGVTTESASMGSTFAVPTGSRYGRFMLLNGASGLTRVPAAIRSAYAAYFDSTSRVQTWDFDEHSGSSVAATLSEASSDSRDVTLAARLGWFAQSAFPWGALSGDDPSQHFRWDVATEFTKRDMPRTEYRKVVAEP